MKTCFLILMPLFYISCTNRQPEHFDKYKALINKVDSIQIEYPRVKKSISLPKDQVENLKAILLRNIDPVEQKQFESDARINLFAKNKLIAIIQTVDSDKFSFVNIYSDSLNFGFKMTYGIGMYLMEANSNPDFKINN